MRKLLYLLSLLFFALPAHAQCTNANVQDFSGGTNGVAPTATTLAAGASGVDGNATWSVSASVPFTYATAASGALSWNQSYCAGGSYANTSTLGLSWDEGVASTNKTVKINYPTNRGNLNVATAGVWFSTNLAQNSNVNIDNGPTILAGSSYNNVILASVGGVLYITCEATPTACHNTSGGAAPHINIASNYTRYWITTSWYRSDAGVTCSPPGTLDGCNRGRVYQEDAAHPGSVGTLLGEWYSAPGGTAQNPVYDLIGNIISDASRPGETRRFDHWLNCYNTTVANCPWPLLPATSSSSNILIDAKRSMDWTQTGIPNGVPSGSWTQFGTTLPAGTYAGATIRTNMTGCDHQFYQLGAGVFTITGTINFPSGGKCVLRGLGANSTFIIASGAGSTCKNLTAVVCLRSSNDDTFGSITNQCDWTGGFAQGGTAITLTNCQGAGIGAISTTTPSMIILSQANTGYTGSPVPTYTVTGSAVDNNQLFICSDKYSTGPTLGCSSNGNGGGAGNRDAIEIHTANSVVGSTVNLSTGLVRPDWAIGQAPQAYIITTPIVLNGVENLSIDLSAGGVAQACVQMFNAYQNWVTGVACLHNKFSGIDLDQTSHVVIEKNYVYDSTATLPSGYGIRPTYSFDFVIQNNIVQQIFSPIFADNLTQGGVIAFNYVPCLPQVGNNFLFAGITEHFTNIYNLEEENVSCQSQYDSVHGAAPMNTRFRNFYTGWWSQPSTPITVSTNALSNYYASRYSNDVGNVLGTPGYHTTYKGNGGNLQIIVYGNANNAVSPAVPSDPLVSSTSMPYANYDTVTVGTRYCGSVLNTGWVATCGSVSEIPIAASTYPNALPTYGDTVAGQAALPNSLYLTAKPAWVPAASPWPLIGPDVTTGNVGQCAGALNTSGKMNGLPGTASPQCTGSTLTGTGWANHVYAIPAMTCALSLGMPLDGSGGALPFDANSCYANVVGGNTSGISPTGVVY